jgi:hypothetical protein
MLPVSTPELLSKCVPPLLTVLTVAGLQAGLIFWFQLFWQQAHVNAWVLRDCIEVFGGHRSKYFTPALWIEMVK